jgi:hypothetical protein
MGVQGPLYQDNSKDMQQLQGTIISDKFYTDFYSDIYFLFLKILGILFHTVERKMKNLKRQFLSLTESKKQTSKIFSGYNEKMWA